MQDLKKIRDKWIKENSELGIKQQNIAKSLCMGYAENALKYTELAIKQDMTSKFIQDIDFLINNMKGKYIET